MTEQRFCNFCQNYHPLTGEWWYFNSSRTNCRERLRVYHKVRYQENKERLKRYALLHYENNRNEIRNKQNEYSRKNKDKQNEYKRKKTLIDLNFRLSCTLRKRLGKVLRRDTKVGSAVGDLGCSIAFLKQYIESKFQAGMTWGNYGSRGWHIDHIVPLSRFDLSDREQLLVACHYTNLQPLWAEDNLRKGNKVQDTEGNYVSP